MSLAEPALAAEFDLGATLRDRFGLAEFRAGQREVIEQVLARRDVLCVMPTGGGKSLCYQLPAVLLDGLTLVVSPLIALMKDQVDALTRRGIRATLINSTLDPAEQQARMLEIGLGRYDLVYVAPERFRSTRFLEAIARAKPALLAVDEAHCISEWGHDFRPDYARIGAVRKRLGSPPCVALTATATDIVRRDIADQLDLRSLAQFVTGFDRPNLSYRVVQASGEMLKSARLAEVLERQPGSAIVYASSRARCETVGAYLKNDLRIETVIYHAGLERDARTAAQEKFMAGKARVVVATNAFGMGVDKPDIRAVVHYNLPGTLEAYYQEAGRAGRDGLPAECVLLYAVGDRFLQEMFIENAYPAPAHVRHLYEFLRRLDDDPIELTHAEMKEKANVELSEQAVGAALKLLEGGGALERFAPRENMGIVRFESELSGPETAERIGPNAHVQRTVWLGLAGLVEGRVGEPVYFHPGQFAQALGLDRPALARALKHLCEALPITYVPPFRGNAVRIADRKRTASALALDFTPLLERKKQEYDKLKRMIAYAEGKTCRRAYILGYFGDASSTQCGRCDRCESAGSEPAYALPSGDAASGREVFLKILSGVARAKGRVGKVAVAQMLTGSGSEKMGRLGLANLSTYGILKEFTQPEVVQILDGLVEQGFIESRELDHFRPAIALTDEGWSYLRAKGEQEISLSLPAYLAAKVYRAHSSDGAELPESQEHAESSPVGESSDVPTAALNDGLAQRLKSLRTEWAKAAGQPAYCVFTNETLEHLVRERPTNPRALAAIKGMGPARMERFGEALLEAIAGARPEPAVEIVPSRYPALLKTPNNLPSEEWTWRLLERGFTGPEAAAIRRMSIDLILGHALVCAGNGKRVPVEAFVPAPRLQEWRAWRRERQEPPSLIGDLEELAWRLFLACEPSSDEPER